jgi:cytochrome c6
MRPVERLRLLLVLCAATVSAGQPAVSGADPGAPAELGKEVFTTIAQPPCGACHTLADAGTAGTTGPNLDEQQPTEEDAKLMVTEGAGVMPGYGPLLTQEQIDAVANYVSSVAGQTK